MSCDLEFLFQTFPGDSTAAYTRPYCSLYPDVLQLIPGGTEAYIVTCDFNENPKSDFDFDLGFVNMLSEKNMFDNILLVICRYDLKNINIYKQLYFYVL